MTSDVGWLIQDVMVNISTRMKVGNRLLRRTLKEANSLIVDNYRANPVEYYEKIF